MCFLSWVFNLRLVLYVQNQQLIFNELNKMAASKIHFSARDSFAYNYVNSVIIIFKLVGFLLYYINFNLK